VVYKYLDYLIGKLTVSAWCSRYCNWMVVFIKVHIALYVAHLDHLEGARCHLARNAAII
jgi:hypothetical protein